MQDAKGKASQKARDESTGKGKSSETAGKGKASAPGSAAGARYERSIFVLIRTSSLTS